MSLPTLQVVLDNRWDINTPQSWREPPYLGWTLMKEKKEEVVRWFLAHGADPNAFASQEAITPLSRAVKYSSLAMVRFLFQHGGRADRGELVNYVCQIKPGDEQTLLILRFLLEKGAPPNHILYEEYPELFDLTMFSLTPLLTCCVKGDTEAARVLLRYGADPCKTAVLMNKLPIDLAREHGHQDLVDLLTRAMNPSYKASALERHVGATGDCRRFG
ncbi:hypothetical protein A1O1_07850 [Capronia coronata CBS 617.96]|uniref:Uncharacterized protein n=1 Tax=Capronia coronata CBS 617.96 TaxID=1182541 RepID=W9XWP6_9EURO|nr:uncharacterized protein A1O1_07850 [Capronia coronata CBS 617.96]EXJ81785.1 hypothetical protein A1O1_07850 [Capronia coronata CBS 617.96]